MDRFLFLVLGQRTIVVFFVLQNGFCLLWIFHKPLPFAMFVLYCLEHTGGISTSCPVRQKTNSSKSSLSSKEHLYGKCSQWVQYKDQDWTLCRHLQYIIIFSHIYIFIYIVPLNFDKKKILKNCEEYPSIALRQFIFLKRMTYKKRLLK